MLSPFSSLSPSSPSIRTSSGVFEPFTANNSTSGSPVKSSPTVSRSRSSSMSQNSSRTFSHYREPTVLEKPDAVDEIRNALADRNVSKLAELVQVHGSPPSLRPAAWPLLLKDHPLVRDAETKYADVCNGSAMISEDKSPLKRIRGDIHRSRRIGGIGPQEEREIYEAVVEFLKKFATIIPYESPMVWIAEFLLNGEHVSLQETQQTSSHSSHSSHRRHSEHSNTPSSREETPKAESMTAQNTGVMYTPPASEKSNNITPAERLETLRLSSSDLSRLNDDNNGDNTITEGTFAESAVDDTAISESPANGTPTDNASEESRILGDSPSPGSSVELSPLTTPPPLSAPGLVSSGRRGISTSSVSSADSENSIVSFTGVNTGTLNEIFTQIMLFMHAIPPQYSEFVTLLRTYLPQLGQHFACEGVLGPSGGDDWLSWWLRWLGIRAFPADMLARLWDTYFAMRDPSQSVMKQHLFNCIVLMRGNRANLGELDQSECRQFLLHSPPCKDLEASIVEGKALAKTDPS